MHFIALPMVEQSLGKPSKRSSVTEKSFLVQICTLHLLADKV